MIQGKEDTICKSIVNKLDFDFGIHQYECVDGKKKVGKIEECIFFLKTCE